MKKNNIVGLGKCLLAACCAFGIACLTPMDKSVAAQNKQGKAQNVQRKAGKKSVKSSSRKASGKFAVGRGVECLKWGKRPNELFVRKLGWRGTVVGYDPARRLYSVKIVDLLFPHSHLIPRSLSADECSGHEKLWDRGNEGSDVNKIIKVPERCLSEDQGPRGFF